MATRQQSEILRDLSSNLCIDPKDKNVPAKEGITVDDLFLFPWASQMYIFIPNLTLCNVHKLKLREDEIHIEAPSEISSL